MYILEDLPDHIYVARLKDIFGNNNSDLYPSNVPELDIYDRIESIRPIFHTAYSGTCIITGDYNHCFYNGKYYFLRKLDPLDLRDNTYKYQLDEDIILNILAAECTIKGTLIRTNREDILGENENTIQSCVPILNNPTERHILTFVPEEKIDGRKTIQIIEPPVNATLLLNTLLSKKTYRAFKDRCNKHPFKKGLKEGVNYRTNDDGYTFYNTSDPLFVFDGIFEEKIISYKAHVLTELIKFLCLLSKKKEKFNVTLRSQSGINVDYLSGKYCVTYDDATGLGGTTETSVWVKSFDFSKLEDIVPMSTSSKTPLEGLSHNENNLGDLVGYQKRLLCPMKLCRKPHLPIVGGFTLKGHREEINKMYYSAYNWRDEIDLIDFKQETTYTGNSPQRVTFDNGEEGNLIYVNRLDFAFAKGFKEWYDSGYDKGITRNFLTTGYPDRSGDYYSEYAGRKNFNVRKQDILPLGIKIFSIAGDPNKGDDFEYISNTKTNEVTYISGLSPKARDEYSDNKVRLVEGYAKFGTLNPLLTKLILELDGTRMSHIWPSDNLHKKYYSYDYSGYFYYFKNEKVETEDVRYPARNGNGEYRIGQGKSGDQGYGKYQQLKNNQQRKQFIDTFFLSSITRLYKDYYGKQYELFLEKNDIFFFREDGIFKVSSHLFYQLPFITSQSQRETIPMDSKNVKSVEFFNEINSSLFIKKFDDSVKRELGGLGLPAFYNEGILKMNEKISGYIGSVKNFDEELRPRYRPVTGDLQTYDKGLNGTKARETLRNTILTMGDFFGTNSQFLSQGVVIYLYKKGLHLGFVNHPYADLKVHQDSIITKVEGNTYTMQATTHIKHITTLQHDLDDMFIGKDTEILKAYFEGFDSPLYNITPEQLKNPTSGQYVFDLKGTNGYAVFSKGKIHLVAKDNAHSDTFGFEDKDRDKKVHTATPDPKKITKPDIYETINQKAYLTFYGRDRVLSSKFSLDKPIYAYTVPVILPNVETATEYYRIEFDHEKIDFIDEWVPTLKEVKKGTEIVDYEGLKLQMEKSDLEYAQYQQLNELAINRQKVKAFRENQDLDDQYTDQSGNTALGALSVGAGMLMKKSPIAAAGALAAGVKNLQSGITFLTRDYAKLKGRVKEDSRLFMEENSMALLHRKQNYEHNIRSQKIKLNAITNTYIKPTINDVVVQKKYNTDKGLNDIQLHVFLPNKKQIQQIRFIYSNYGCECISTRFEVEPLVVKNNMEEGLYQFSELQPDAISCKATEDLFINEVVRSLFESGVKFKHTQHIATQEKHEDLQKKLKLEFDITKIPEGTTQVWSAFVKVKDKKTILDSIKTHEKLGLTEDEYNNNKENIEATKTNDAALFNLINDIILNRREGQIYISDLDPLIKAEIENKKIKQQLDECIQQKGELEQSKKDLEQCKQELKNKSDEHTINTQNLNNQIKDKDREITQTKQQLESYKQQLNQCKADLTKKKNDVISATEKVKKLTQDIETQKATCDGEKKSLQQEVAKIPVLEEELRKCDTELKTHKAEKQKLQQEVGVVKQQIAEKNREIEFLKSQKQDIERQLRECLSRSGGSEGAGVLQQHITEIGKTLDNVGNEHKNEVLEACKKYETTKESLSIDAQNILGEACEIKNMEPISIKDKLNRNNRMFLMFSQLSKKELDDEKRKSTDTQKLNVLKSQYTAKNKELGDLTNQIDVAGNNIKLIIQRNCNNYETNKNRFSVELQKIYENACTIKNLEATTPKTKFDRLMRGVDNQFRSFQQTAAEAIKRITDAHNQITKLITDKQDLQRQLKDCMSRPIQPIPQDVSELQNEITTLTNKFKNCQQKLDALNIDNACETFYKLVNDPYHINTTQRPTGDLAKELMMAVATQKVEINNTNIRNETKKYPMIQTLLNTIEDLEHIDGIAVYEDAMSLDGWYKYEQFKKTGGTKDSDVDEVISVLNELDNYLGSPKLRALKFVLDEIAFRAYMAKAFHSAKTKTDPDNPHKRVSDIDLDENLQYLLGGFITKGREEYKRLYGDDIDEAIKRKWYSSGWCLSDFTVPKIIEVIKDKEKTITYVTTDVPTQETPPDEHFINYIDEEASRFVAKRPYSCRLGISRQFITYKGEFNFKPFRKYFSGSEYSVLFIESETKDYARYWSREAHSGYKYYTYYETKLYDYSYISKTGDKLRSALQTNQQTYVPIAFYCHWAGQLSPTDFFDRRYSAGVSLIKQFEYAISHEDMRDQIKRTKSLIVRVKHTYTTNSDIQYKEKHQLYILSTTQNRNFFPHFGKRDSYKALWIACVLTGNGLYMNKIGQGNDYGKFKIQPLGHPFHDLDKQEVINLMTNAFNKTKTLELGIEFGGWSTLVEIISCIIKGNYEVLKFPEIRRGLEGMNNVGYYEGKKEKNADLADYN